MGNTESSASSQVGSQANVVASAANTAPPPHAVCNSGGVKATASRPLRSILRPASISSQTGSDADSQRRSVVFADQAEPTIAHVRFTYQPFPEPAPTGERVTHFGAATITDEAVQNGVIYRTEGAADNAMEVDGGVGEEAIRFPVTHNMNVDSYRRRKKRAPPVPPPRRDSINSSTRSLTFSASSGSLDRRQSDTADEIEDLRKKLRLDLQESRKEYERLKSLQQPLARKENNQSRDVCIDRIYAHLKTTREGPDDRTVTPASSTETLKGANTASGSTPRRTVTAGQQRRQIDMDKFKRLDSEDEASDEWMENAKQKLAQLDLDGSRRAGDPGRAGSIRRRFIISKDPQWSCQSSDSGISNTLPPDLDEQLSSIPPGYASSTSSAASVPLRKPAPPSPPAVQPPPPVLRRLRMATRSEADSIPTFRLPNSRQAAMLPKYSSAEPLFAFDDRSSIASQESIASHAGDGKRRRSMNDSFRRMRSSLGRVFGSIGRSSTNLSTTKRRPVSMANFDSPAHVYYSQHAPLEAWQLTGSVHDLSDAEIGNARHQTRSLFDEHLDSVWHEVVRTSHEQLRLSNPSFFEEVGPGGGRQLGDIDEAGDGVRWTSNRSRYRELYGSARVFRQHHRDDRHSHR